MGCEVNSEGIAMVWFGSSVMAGIYAPDPGLMEPTSLLPAAQEPVHLRFMCGAVMMQRFRVGGFKIIQYVIKYTGFTFSLEDTTWSFADQRGKKFKESLGHTNFFSFFSHHFLNRVTPSKPSFYSSLSGYEQGVVMAGAIQGHVTNH